MTELAGFSVLAAAEGLSSLVFLGVAIGCGLIIIGAGFGIGMIVQRQQNQSAASPKHTAKSFRL